MRRYQDISHFRAPYKNIPVAGFGADEALPANTERVPGGLISYTAAAKASIGPMLKLMNFVSSGGGFPGEENGALQAMTPEMIAAAEKDPAYAATLYATSGLGKVEQWFKEDKIVFLSYSITTMTPPITMAAVPRSSTARLVEIAGLPYHASAPAFQDPTKPVWTSASSKAGIGTFGMVAIAVAVLGVGYFVYQGSKHKRYGR